MADRDHPPARSQAAISGLDGRQGADLVEIVRPTTCLRVPHGDYGVFRDPVETFHQEVQRRGLAGSCPIARGHTVTL